MQDKRNFSQVPKNKHFKVFTVRDCILKLQS